MNFLKNKTKMPPFFPGNRVLQTTLPQSLPPPQPLIHSALQLRKEIPSKCPETNLFSHIPHEEVESEHNNRREMVSAAKSGNKFPQCNSLKYEFLLQKPMWEIFFRFPCNLLPDNMEVTEKSSHRRNMLFRWQYFPSTNRAVFKDGNKADKRNHYKRFH